MPTLAIQRRIVEDVAGMCDESCERESGARRATLDICFNLFGSTDDLREAISRIAAARPEAPLCLYGISAGTALLVRYLGEEGAQTPVVAAVANCPGYDISVCLTRVGWLYDAGYYLKALKRHWLEGENGAVLRAHDPQLCERLQHAHGARPHLPRGAAST